MNSPAAHAVPPHQQFVAWMRQVAPWLHAFHGATIVVAIPGEVLQAGRLDGLVQDLSLLNSIGINTVVINGCRPQIDAQLRLRDIEPRFVDGQRLTDAAALECAKAAAGAIRLEVEAAFSQGLPNTPMAHSSIRVASGNYVLARPVGVVDGVDFQYTGQVRKVDTAAIRTALDHGAVVLLSNIGFSPTGEAFNLQMEEVAAAVATSRGADKLVYLVDAPGVLDQDGRVITEISESDAEQRLSSSQVPRSLVPYLRSAAIASRGGVPRSHLVPMHVDGQVLLEFFLHDGIGTMVVPESLEALREAGPDDVPGILTLIEPLEQDGTLVKRDRALIEAEVENFSVIEHDRVIFGCAALYPFPAERIGELACVAVSPHTQGHGDGERLVKHIEQRARAAGLTRLFVLTTRTTHWFLRRGFVLGTVEDLPAGRKGLYNYRRNSKVLVKDL